MGGNRTGLPSSFRTCKEAISARQRGNDSIRFFWTDKTFSEVNFTSSGGKILSLFPLRSRISREVNWHICNSGQYSPDPYTSRTFLRTDWGNSRMMLLRTFRYLSDVHSENLAGNVEIRLCDSASLEDKRCQLRPSMTEVGQDRYTFQVHS